MQDVFWFVYYSTGPGAGFTRGAAAVPESLPGFLAVPQGVPAAEAAAGGPSGGAGGLHGAAPGAAAAGNQAPVAQVCVGAGWPRQALCLPIKAALH